MTSMSNAVTDKGHSVTGLELWYCLLRKCICRQHQECDKTDYSSFHKTVFKFFAFIKIYVRNPDYGISALVQNYLSLTLADYTNRTKEYTFIMTFCIILDMVR